jgi:HEAT repeat protein/DNA-binding winged helix-turn-helix (wHTH) protein
MNKTATIRNGFRLGQVILDADTGELFKNRQFCKRLPPQVLKVLLELLRHPRDIVTRKTLEDLLWKGTNTNITDPGHAINKIIRRLRQDFGDSKDDPRHIEVIPRVGFRFIASVDKVEPPAVWPTTTHEEHSTANAPQLEEVCSYLAELAGRTAELPHYYPPHLTSDASGVTCFDGIRQIVQVAEDPKGFERWQAEEQDRIRAGGLDPDHLAYYYKPWRSNPEQETEPQGMRKRLEAKEHPKTIAWDEQAGERWHRAVILGDPGFGKTWLLRYEARRLALDAQQSLLQHTLDLDQVVLPIFARMSDVAWFTGGVEEGLVALVGEQHTDQLRGWVREKLDTDRCVILLDGWDEVPAEAAERGQIAEKPGHRQHLGRRLESFARRFPRPRLLMTSRLVGYAGSPIPRAKELELLAFDTEQQEGFVGVWFREEKQKGAAFLEALRQNPQVRGLARIPLMLALLCRVHQEGQLSVPTRQADVYDCCLRGLLRDWLGEKQRREVSDAYVDAQVELLGAVACDLFCAGYEQFGEGLLRAKLMPRLEKLKPTNELYGRAAESLIAEMKNVGILTSIAEHGEPKLIFLHRTFQEYLAAGGLAEELKGDSGQVWGGIDRKAWDPEWEQVMVYLAARLGDIAVGHNKSMGERKRKLRLRQLKHLLMLLTDKKKDDYFRHRLALAAQCLPEIPDDIRRIISRDVRFITATAFEQLWQRAIEETDWAVPHLTRALPAIGRVNGTWLSQRLERSLRHPGTDVWWVSWRLGTVGEVAVQLGFSARLADLLYDANPHVRHMGAGAARSLDPRKLTPDVQSRLIELLGEEEEIDAGAVSVRIQAMSSLVHMGSALAGPGTLQLLHKLLHDSNFKTRGAAAMVVGAVGKAAGTPEILGRLTEMICDQESYPADNAARALASMGAAAATPAVLTRIAELLEDEDDVVFYRASQVMQDRGDLVAGPRVLSRIAQWLYSADPHVRYRTAESANYFGNMAATPEIISRLTELLEDKEANVREAAAMALGSFGSAAATNPGILARLTELLQDEQDEYYLFRDGVAEAIGTLTSEVSPDLAVRLGALLEDKKWWVRSAALRAVECLGAKAASTEMAARIVKLLHDDDRFVRRAAVLVVNQWGYAVQSQAVAASLKDLLWDPDPDVRIEAALTVAGAGIASLQFEPLAQLLRHRDSWVRSSAALAVRSIMGSGLRFFRDGPRRWRTVMVRELTHSVKSLPLST